MASLTADDITTNVLRHLEQTPSPRLKEILTSLIRHLHAFVREVQLTEAEWFEGIRFLTETGRMCSDTRQEFILLSDVLGVSILVDLFTHRKPAGATETTLLGPFYVEGAPELPQGASIVRTEGGMPLVFSGCVRDLEGKPIAGALLDVWQTAANGLYDVQDPQQPAFNMRGKFRTDAQGRFLFRTVRPISYPVPTDGPVGRLFAATKRQPYRPAHIHFIVTAPGYTPLVTHLFDAEDPYLQRDAVFAFKPSLTFTPVRHDSAEGAPLPDLPLPYYSATYDFVLTRAEEAG
ncbi:MAG: 6-chlorohydroxyquinol-1,2-dioxygenase [Candidatus Tectimicrobiota bacterium]|nr:MAG: 6-chlorohydroxyquinol-1,2-dioxygenase [Candidatus Tectomicrobia bacterium]